MNVIPDSTECPLWQAEQAAFAAMHRAFLAHDPEYETLRGEYLRAREARARAWEELGWDSLNTRLTKAIFK